MINVTSIPFPYAPFPTLFSFHLVSMTHVTRVTRFILFKLGIDLDGLLLATLGDVFDLEGCFRGVSFMSC
jgi:hypothetical protein